MSKRPKFRPEITRIKLNSEQAVLNCNCYNAGARYATGWVIEGSHPTALCHEGRQIIHTNAHSHPIYPLPGGFPIRLAPFPAHSDSAS